MSSTANREQIDLRAVGDASIDSGLPGGAALSAVVDAAVLRDEAEMPLARAAAIERIGPEATMRAVAVAGNFEMMNRLLDAIGVGPAPQMRDIGEAIGVPLPSRWR